MKKTNILLVEDDINLGYVIQDSLEIVGYKVSLCTDGKSGLQYFNKNNYDICILDVMLPQKDGFSLAKDIRKTDQKVPIIFLTAKTLTEDKIKGFKAGGDDYLTKPFAQEELNIRIEALLKRSGHISNDSSHQFEIGEYTYNSEEHTLTLEDERKKLTKKESAVLKILSENINKTIERDLILNMIWGKDDYFTGRSLDVFITKLRKYLSSDSKVSILNQHGIGFKLEVK